jgi:hypothetical protein
MEHKQEFKITISTDPSADMINYLENLEVDAGDRTIWQIREAHHESGSTEITLRIVVERISGEDELDKDDFCSNLYNDINSMIPYELNELYDAS